jgi:hypothetical protein
MVIRTEVKFYTVMTVFFSVARGIDLFLYFTVGIIPQRNVQKGCECECMSLSNTFSAFAYLILHYKPITTLAAPRVLRVLRPHPVFHSLHYFLIASLAPKKNEFVV